MTSNYMTAQDMRRAAAWTLHILGGDNEAATIVAEDGPIHPLAVIRACEAAAPALWLDSDTCAENLSAHIQTLVELENGIGDDTDDD